MGSYEVALRDGRRTPVENESAKREAASKMAARLRPDEVVGVGSGSTSRLTLEALAARSAVEGFSWTAIATSYEVELACAEAGVPIVSLATRRPDWSFDGADEVDPTANLIKGRGGALLREKLVMAASPERYVVVDPSKLVARLGERHPVPVEVVPEAVRLVIDELGRRGWRDVALRAGGGKDGPVITERGNYLLDVTVRDVPADAEAWLKSLPGVVESGLFVGYAPTVVVAG